MAPIDRTSRSAVAQAYQAVYVPTLATRNDWNGNADTCAAGDTSLGYKQAVIRMVNYYRASAGLPGVSLNLDFSAKAQQAALMFDANNALSHNPPTSWRCYSAAGAEGAGSSNIAIGSPSLTLGGMKLYMDDTGVESLGHRRWVLFPPQTQMGTGDTFTTNALWVFGPRGSRPSMPEGVAWPPSGFVPYAVAPVQARAQWSFSMPGASFANSTVEVRDGSNQAVALNVTRPANGYGDPTIAFGPANGAAWPVRPPGDTSFDVTVRNVTVNGAARDFSYRVTLITP